MPTKAEDTVTKDCLYPDDLTGRTVEIDPEQRLENGLAFWRPDESEADDEQTPEGARHGYWLPVDDADDGEVWMSCPRDLREAMLRNGVESGDVIEILSHEKGPGDTDPWMAEIALITDG